MDQNPINNERIVTIEYQLREWAAGRSVHNGIDRRHGECCPDFSCCYPNLFIVDKGERARIASKQITIAVD